MTTESLARMLKALMVGKRMEVPRPGQPEVKVGKNKHSKDTPAFFMIFSRSSSKVFRRPR